MKGAECGEGLQRRNVSCVVHWGDWPDSPPQFVQDELCGEKLMRRIQQEMEQPCFIPCPGKAALRYIGPMSFKCVDINYMEG